LSFGWARGSGVICRDSWCDSAWDREEGVGLEFLLGGNNAVDFRLFMVAFMGPCRVLMPAVRALEPCLVVLVGVIFGAMLR
jgi:hypothetical protein